MRLAAFIKDCDASALAEFAVALPLLVVLVYGIFDFGGAFNLKHRLSNAAREGARFASSLPTNDLDSPGTPPSIDSVRLFVDAYLIDAKVNDCGLSTATGVPGALLTWTYSTTGGLCPGPLVLEIQRSDAVPTTIGGSTIYVICTRVTLQYAYQWRLNNVIQLVAPGASFGLATITTDATVPNMD